MAPVQSRTFANAASRAEEAQIQPRMPREAGGRKVKDWVWHMSGDSACGPLYDALN